MLPLLAAVPLIPVADPTLAVIAMFVAIRPLMTGALGPRSHLSWRRGLFLLTGGCAALVGTVGLLALRGYFFGDAFYLPSWLGATLAFFGGMLGVSTVLAGRGEGGLSESGALKLAMLSGAMVVYLASPLVALGLLGLTHGLRACLPWTVVRRRWLGVAEGVIFVALALLPRDEELGGLRGRVVFGDASIEGQAESVGGGATEEG